MSIVSEIVERRKLDISKKGWNLGFEIPEKRTRPVHPFMAEKGVILEVKRASPSKGDIAPSLDSAATAKQYAKTGALAISCLTEENYFKGNLQDLQKVCQAVDEFEKETGKTGPAVLRKDFLIDEKEIEVAFLCGADAVLLISGILSLEKMQTMAQKCKDLGISALVEVRTEEDAEKVLELKKDFADTIVCGVNSRNLKDFTIDLLVPAMLKNKLGGKVIFESGITTPEAAFKISSMGFAGILLGEFAARNPQKAGDFVKAFKETQESLCGNKLLNLAEKIKNKGKKPLIKVCGLTRVQDLQLADSLGADFTGFIFATEFKRNVYGQKFELIKPALKDIKALKVAVITRPETPEAKAACQYVKEGILDFVQIHAVDYESIPEYLKEVPHYFAVTEKQGNLKDLCQKMFDYGEPRYLQDSSSHSYGNLDHLWMAGGITPENVESLISQFNPELVDLSSGIEDDEIGVKNPEKMKEFFKIINNM